MIYLKSILVAVAAFLIPFILYDVSVVVWTAFYAPTVVPPPPPPLTPSPGEVGFGTSTAWVNVDFLVPVWVPLILGILTFGITLRWMLRRASTH